MNDLAILRLADGLARHAAERHGLISKNVANADTAGYRARDLAPFEVALNDAETLKATRAAHLSGGAEARFDATFSAPLGASSPNGNDVAVDAEMAKAAQALGTHGKAVAVYAKTMDILRLGLGRG